MTKIPSVVTIQAILPTERQCVGFKGDGSGKISLDTDGQQLGNVVSALIAMKGQLVEVTFKGLGEKKPHKDDE
jgi:hypothetical protein